MHPERVVVGTSSPKVGEVMRQLYAPFVEDINNIIVMDERSSELTKYAANSFLATKISFMNEISRLCEIAGADVDLIRRGIGTDSRIGSKFLYAGIGYGGSCFPKDVQALHFTAGKLGYDFRILDAVMNVNQSQKQLIVTKLDQYFQHDLAGKTIGVWGLAFKPDTDDVREAPALEIITALLQRGAHLQAYDPEAIDTFRSALGPELSEKIQFVQNREDALKNADALVICTEWNEFRSAEFSLFHEQMKKPVLFDGRNIFSLERAREANVTYFSIGRESIVAKED
jgi:UDPglucose 6-dehydrogenase